MNRAYPEMVEALEREPADDFIADGEIVAFEDGITSFARLQRAAASAVPVFLYLFDLLRLDGDDLPALPLRQRKARLRRALAFGGRSATPRTATRARRGDVPRGLRKGLEGVIAKRADSPYWHGRSRDWLKLKCAAEQELVIGGFTAPRARARSSGRCWWATTTDGRAPLRRQGRAPASTSHAAGRSASGCAS